MRRRLNLSAAPAGRVLDEVGEEGAGILLSLSPVCSLWKRWLFVLRILELLEHVGHPLLRAESTHITALPAIQQLVTLLRKDLRRALYDSGRTCRDKKL